MEAALEVALAAMTSIAPENAKSKPLAKAGAVVFVSSDRQTSIAQLHVDHPAGL